MSAIGIDLGTTFSLVGLVQADGQPKLCPDRFDDTSFRTPSIVHIGEDAAFIGDVVAQLLEEDQKLPIVAFPKIHMGQDTVLFVDPLRREWTAAALSALILKKLKQDAEAAISGSINRAVIAVPAQFNNAQREATRLAGVLAGLEVLALVEEPVAAATYYGLSESEEDKTLFVYDLGGGTFDATLLQASKNGLFVLATEGVASIGGKLFDELIMKSMAVDFELAHGINPMLDAVSAIQLRRYAEDAKIALSQPDTRHVRETILIGDKTLDFIITRGQFEKLIRRHIEETLECSKRCLGGASLKWSDVDKILLTGGSTLVPLVSTMIQAISGLGADRIICKQPHEAVALGTSVLAGAKDGDVNNLHQPALIQQITSFDLSMRVWDKSADKPGLKTLIKRNTPVPVSHTTTFYTTRHDQTRIVFELVQTKGGDDPGASIGSFSFGPIKTPKKNYPIDVTISYDLNGIVQVVARDPHTKEEIQRQFEREENKPRDRLLQLSELVRSVRLN